jgi:hypothetical protein
MKNGDDEKKGRRDEQTKHPGQPRQAYPFDNFDFGQAHRAFT